MRRPGPGPRAAALVASLSIVLPGITGCGGAGGGEVPQSESVEKTQGYIQNPFGDPAAQAVDDEFAKTQPPK